jgi:glycosyltransferase involved in cell wall biosynthesis
VAEQQRILHIVNGEFYAGAERVQDLLALRLPALGFDVDFVCLKHGVFAERRESRQTPLLTVVMTSRIDMRVISQIVARVRTRDCRLIHTHTPRAALVGSIVARLTGVPMVHHVHSPTESDTEHRWRNWRNSVVERFSIGNARKLIPVSASLANALLAKGYAPAQIQLVPNGVPARLKSRMNYVPGSPLVIGTVALFRPRKGIETLLAALAALRAEGLDVTLRAVGPFETPAYQRSTEALVQQLGLAGRVIWTGFSSDVAAELGKLHVFVLPSLYGEGMPMVLLEAMAVGLPIIATRVEGIPELVRDGQDGVIVAPGDATGLAAAIRQIASGDYNAAELGDSAWLRQRSEYSDTVMAGRIAGIYREVLQP